MKELEYQNRTEHYSKPQVTKNTIYEWIKASLYICTYPHHISGKIKATAFSIQQIQTYILLLQAGSHCPYQQIITKISTGSEQLAHPRSLFRASSAYKEFGWTPRFPTRKDWSFLPLNGSIEWSVTSPAEEPRDRIDQYLAISCQQPCLFAGQQYFSHVWACAGRICYKAGLFMTQLIYHLLIVSGICHCFWRIPVPPLTL